MSDWTHFGFERIAADEKAARVGGVFSSVASRYDLMNDVMSLGLHHVWKRIAVAAMEVHHGDTLLDLAGGSGDLSRLLAKKVGPDGQVILADLNPDMLAVGRNRLLDQGLGSQVVYVQANAEALPFAPNTLNGVIIGFGLRNFTQPLCALDCIYQACRPGSKLVILEFTLPTNPALRRLYDFYSFAVMPKLGHWIAADEASYRYLAESIRMHATPDQLRAWMEQVGFEDCRYDLLSGGIVAIHQGYKY